MLIALIAVSLASVGIAVLLVIALCALGVQSKKEDSLKAIAAELQSKLKATEDVAMQYAAAYTDLKSKFDLATRPTDAKWH